MVDMINQLLLFTGDTFLGWAVRVSPDLALVLVALLSALSLVLVRLLTTDQDLLGRCHADKKRLGVLIKQARKQKDKPTIQRLRHTKGLIGLKQMRSEGKPLLLALLPIAFLGTWAWQRLAYLPLKPEEPFTFTATYPASASGKLAYLLPPYYYSRGKDLSPQGWIQEIAPATNAPDARAQTVWMLRTDNGPAEFDLDLRFEGILFEHPIAADGLTACAPRTEHPNSEVVTEIDLRRYHAFGGIPNIPDLFLPSWLIGYLLLTIPLVSALKRLFRVH